VFIEAKDDESGGDNWSYRSCKAPVKSSPRTNQHPVFLQAGCPSCHPTNSVKALMGKYHIPWICLPQAHLGLFQLCLWPLIAPSYLGVAMPLISPLMPVPHINDYLTLSLHFNGHFPGEPGLAGVYWRKGWWRWWWQLDYWRYKSCKAPVKSSPPTNQHPVFLQAVCPSCRPTNSVKALMGKYHIPWTCLPQAHLGVFQLCLWPLIAPGYLGGGLPCLSSALWCQYPNKLLSNNYK